jgi:hypothetical protein
MLVTLGTQFVTAVEPSGVEFMPVPRLYAYDVSLAVSFGVEVSVRKIDTLPVQVLDVRETIDLEKLLGDCLANSTELAPSFRDILIKDGNSLHSVRIRLYRYPFIPTDTPERAWI